MPVIKWIATSKGWINLDRATHITIMPDTKEGKAQIAVWLVPNSDLITLKGREAAYLHSIMMDRSYIIEEPKP